jgi:hypothetical protein
MDIQLLSDVLFMFSINENLYDSEFGSNINIMIDLFKDVVSTSKELLVDKLKIINDDIYSKINSLFDNSFIYNGQDSLTSPTDLTIVEKILDELNNRNYYVLYVAFEKHATVFFIEKINDTEFNVYYSNTGAFSNHQEIIVKGWKLLDEILTNANYINCKNISTIIILCILS